MRQYGETYTYISWLQDAMEKKTKVLPLFYEDFLRDPKPELRKVLEFYGIADDVEKRIEFTLEDMRTTETWKRTGIPKEAKEEIKQFLNSSKLISKRLRNDVKKLQKMLEIYGSDKNLVKAYNKYI